MSPEDTSEIILSAMFPTHKKLKLRSRSVGLPQPGKQDNPNENYAEQVALFSRLVMEKSEGPLYRVWSQLDSADHLVIMYALGCFSGKIRAHHYQWAREDLAELKRNTNRLKTFLRRRAEHEEIATRRPHFYVYRQYLAEPEGSRGALGKMLEMEVTHLQWSMADINRRLKARSKWDPRGMVCAQEYVKRRVAFLGIRGRVRLTPAAIADIYQLTQRTSHGGDDPDTVENIRKAIAYFKRNPENAYLVQNIEYYLDGWKKPVSKLKSGN